MNAWTVVGFFVGLGLGLLGAVFVMSLCVAAARADAEMDRAFLDEIGRVD